MGTPRRTEEVFERPTVAPRPAPAPAPPPPPPAPPPPVMYLDPITQLWSSTPPPPPPPAPPTVPPAPAPSLFVDPLKAIAAAGHDVGSAIKGAAAEVSRVVDAGVRTLPGGNAVADVATAVGAGVGAAVNDVVNSAGAQLALATVPLVGAAILGAKELLDPGTVKIIPRSPEDLLRLPGQVVEVVTAIPHAVVTGAAAAFPGEKLLADVEAVATGVQTTLEQNPGTALAILGGAALIATGAGVPAGVGLLAGAAGDIAGGVAAAVSGPTEETAAGSGSQSTAPPAPAASAGVVSPSDIRNGPPASSNRADFWGAFTRRGSPPPPVSDVASAVASATLQAPDIAPATSVQDRARLAGF